MMAANCGGPLTATHPVHVAGLPGISVSPPSLVANVTYGQGLTQTFKIYNTAENLLTYTLAEQPDTVWLAVIDRRVHPPQSSEAVVPTTPPH
jgi:hypothetical protein